MLLPDLTVGRICATARAPNLHNIPEYRTAHIWKTLLPSFSLRWLSKHMTLFVESISSCRKMQDSHRSRFSNQTQHIVSLRIINGQVLVLALTLGGHNKISFMTQPALSIVGLKGPYDTPTLLNPENVAPDQPPCNFMAGAETIDYHGPQVFFPFRGTPR